MFISPFFLALKKNFFVLIVFLIQGKIKVILENPSDLVTISCIKYDKKTLLRGRVPEIFMYLTYGMPD